MDTPQSPPQTILSRLAPSTNIEEPRPALAELSQPLVGGGHTRACWGSMVLSCTVYAPAHHTRLIKSSLQKKWFA